MEQNHVQDLIRQRRRKPSKAGLDGVVECFQEGMRLK